MGMNRGTGENEPYFVIYSPSTGLYTYCEPRVMVAETLAAMPARLRSVGTCMLLKTAILKRLIDIGC